MQCLLFAGITTTTGLNLRRRFFHFNEGDKLVPTENLSSYVEISTSIGNDDLKAMNMRMD